MLRTLVIFLGLVLMLGCGVAIAAWPKAGVAPSLTLNGQQLKSAYVRIRAGTTPASALTSLGFDTASAQKLSYLGVMEAFMPKDSFGFDALDPAVQACFEARDRCIGYVFSVSRTPDARVVLLIKNGRVAFKMISGFGDTVSARPTMRRAALD